MKSRLVLLACCLALLSSCGQGDKGTGKAPEFAVIEAKTTTANLTNSYPATIKGKQDVEIRPMVSGFITKLHVDEGATVRKGQVLFSIDPVQYQAAVNSAKAAVETAKAAVNTQELTVNNKRELNKKNIISDYDLQMAENQLAQTKAQLAQANAQLVNAKNNLSYTSVTSPSDGVVGSIPYRVGSLVSPSVASPLTTVADISEMYAYFSMTERQLLSQIRVPDPLLRRTRHQYGRTGQDSARPCVDRKHCQRTGTGGRIGRPGQGVGDCHCKSRRRRLHRNELSEDQ